MNSLVCAILTMTLLLFGSRPAVAADAAAPYNWSGLYAGVFTGGAFGSDARATELPPRYNNTGDRWRYDLDNSFIGGGQIGYNLQISSIVLGVENEVGYIKQKGSRVDPQSPFIPLDTVSKTEVGSWFDVLAGRVGFAADRLLLYAKGGVAFTEVSSRVDDNCAACSGGTVHASGGKSVATGAVGGGLEYAVANNWSAKAEYLFIDLDKTYTASGPGGGTATGGIFHWKHRVDGLHTVKLGLNYKFW